MKNPEQLALLFEKYLSNDCTRKETQKLMDHFQLNEDQSLLKEMIISALALQDENYQANPLIAELVAKVDVDLFIQIHSARQVIPQRITWTVKLWSSIVAAAAVVLIVLGVYFFHYDNGTTIKNNQFIVHDIAPGKSGATLTLASGKKIRLSDAAIGRLAEESGISISKTPEGQIVYEPGQNTAATDGKNTLTTAKGETYILILPDKSRVWMNAASSLTYSTTLLEDGVRKVKLEGEAYFEVAKDKEHPFVVESKGQQVEVLGTHFNVNAYGDESVIKTTLLEGRVRIFNQQMGKILVPGFEAVNTGEGITLNKVDTELAVAWKNNNFVFANARIETVMKMVERWYNVKIVYQGAMPEDQFIGVVSRFDNISKVLSILESTGLVHFKIKDRTIYVSKSN